MHMKQISVVEEKNVYVVYNYLYVLQNGLHGWGGGGASTQYIYYVPSPP